jgi:hypothetical protein
MGGRNAELLLDSGASLSIMKPNKVKKTEQTDFTVKCISGERTETLGSKKTGFGGGGISTSIVCRDSSRAIEAIIDISNRQGDVHAGTH